jgi:hypothetical protein
VESIVTKKLKLIEIKSFTVGQCIKEPDSFAIIINGSFGFALSKDNIEFLLKILKYSYEESLEAAAAVQNMIDDSKLN